MDRKNESFFAELAKAYAENGGAALKNELSEMAAENKLPHTSGLDRKIKGKLFQHRTRRYWLRSMPLVASLIIALMIYNGYRDGLQLPSSENTPVAYAPTAPSESATSSAPAPPAEESPGMSETPATSPSEPDINIEERLRHTVSFVSANLPLGYELTAIDYDNAAAIMQIINERNNHIVLLTEEYRDFNKDGFTEIEIDGTLAYGLVTNGHSMLKYSKDDMLYIFTSLFGYEDLIEISKNIL